MSKETRSSWKIYHGNPPKLETMFNSQNAHDISKCFFLNFFYIENVVSCVYYVLRVKKIENNAFLNVLCVL